MEKVWIGSALWKATKESTPVINTFAYCGPVVIWIDMARNGLQLNQIVPSAIMIGAIYLIGTRVNKIMSQQ